MPDDLDGENPKLDEYELDWHITYASIFNDPEVLEKASKHRERFQRKGIFSATYELGSD